MDYEPVIGLEIHVELLTRSKMFCGCPVVETTQAEPNTAVCAVCTGMPGALPVVNARAVEYAMMVGLALHCRIAESTFWERKSYFYPDLVKGYQISQYARPLCYDGYLDIETAAGPRRIRVNRAHLEEDAGKLFHMPRPDGEPASTLRLQPGAVVAGMPEAVAGGGRISPAGTSLIDFNRSGVPLLEIVSEPDLHTVDEVKAYAQAVRPIVRYLGVSSGDMEKGVIRFEANVSLRPRGSTFLNPRREVKNLNSFRALVRAVEYEIAYQGERYTRGETVEQETLGWDEARGVTYTQRGKEDAQDYRYFPEPDLPPLDISREWVERVRAALPELPDARRDRFMAQYGLSRYDAVLLTEERVVADWYEEAVAAAQGIASPKAIANWVTGDIFRLMRERGQEIGALEVTPAGLAELAGLVERGTVNINTARDVVFAAMAETGESPAAIVAEKGLGQISDRGALEALVAQVLRDNPGPVNEYLNGKETLLRWFIGQVMRASHGKANPALVQQVLLEHFAQMS